MRYKVTTPPAEEPLTLNEAKEHIRSLADDEDARVESWIVAAREAAEAIIRRPLITRTITAKYDGWPVDDRIVLPLPPLVAVTSIQYVDPNGATQTLAADQYQVVSFDEPAFIVPAYNVRWPTLRAQPDNVTVVFTAGYGAAADVPARAKQAMQMLIAHFDQNRETINIGNIVNELPFGTRALLSSLDWGGYP